MVHKSLQDDVGITHLLKDACGHVQEQSALLCWSPSMGICLHLAWLAWAEQSRVTLTNFQSWDSEMAFSLENGSRYVQASFVDLDFLAGDLLYTASSSLLWVGVPPLFFLTDWVGTADQSLNYFLGGMIRWKYSWGWQNPKTKKNKKGILRMFFRRQIIFL